MELTNLQCEQADRIGEQVERYNRSSRERVEAAIQAGRLLADARKVAPHGTWGAFLKRTKLASSTAHAWISLARADVDDVLAIGGIRAAIACAKLVSVASAARRALGGIDCYMDRPGRDALEQAWLGRTWLVPPEGGRAEFGRYLLAQDKARPAIAMLENSTDTADFHEMLDVVNVACFVRGRFPPGVNTMQGHIVLGIDVDKPRFFREFSPFGLIAVPCR